MPSQALRALRPLITSFDPGDIFALSFWPDDAEPWLGWSECVDQERRMLMAPEARIGSDLELQCDDEGAEEGLF